MTPETRASLIIDYMDGDLPDAMLCAKYGLDQEQLEVAVYIGTGNIMKPEPIKRGMKRGMRHGMAVAQLARDNLTPDQMALSPLQSAEIHEPITITRQLDPDARTQALYLNDAELSFANMVLRGMKPTPAAAAAFEIFNEHLASRKAAELLRSSHVIEYIGKMKGRSLFAPVRNKAYLEAVLHQVIDRGMEMRQVFNPLTGKPEMSDDGLSFVCDYNWKAVISAATLLMKLKGWEGNQSNNTDQESQRDRLRRLQANYTNQGDADE